MAGPQGRSVNTAYHGAVCHTEVDESFRSRFDHTAYVKTFCEEYKADRLVHVIPDRHHDTFKTLKNDKSIIEPHKLKERILKYSRKIDKIRLRKFI